MSGTVTGKLEASAEYGGERNGLSCSEGSFTRALTGSGGYVETVSQLQGDYRQEGVTEAKKAAALATSKAASKAASAAIAAAGDAGRSATGAQECVNQARSLKKDGFKIGPEDTPCEVRKKVNALTASAFNFDKLSSSVPSELQKTTPAPEAGNHRVVGQGFLEHVAGNCSVQ